MKNLFLLFTFLSLLGAGCGSIEDTLETDPVEDPIPGDGNENGIIDQFENVGTPPNGSTE